MPDTKRCDQLTDADGNNVDLSTDSHHAPRPSGLMRVLRSVQASLGNNRIVW
jgi:hypothetical protein